MKSTRLERLAAAIATGTIAHGMARVISNSDEFAKEVMVRALALEAKLNEEELARLEKEYPSNGASKEQMDTDRESEQAVNVGEVVEAYIPSAQGSMMLVRGRVAAVVGKRFRVVFRRLDSTEFELSLSRDEILKVE